MGNLPSRRKSNSGGASIIAASVPIAAEDSTPTASGPAASVDPTRPAPNALWGRTGFTGSVAGFLPPPTLLAQKWLPLRCPNCQCSGGFKSTTNKLGRGKGAQVQYLYTCACGTILTDDDRGPVNVRETEMAPPRCPRCRFAVSPLTDELLWVWTHPLQASCARCQHSFDGRTPCQCSYCMESRRASLPPEPAPITRRRYNDAFPTGASDKGGSRPSNASRR